MSQRWTLVMTNDLKWCYRPSELAVWLAKEIRLRELIPEIRSGGNLRGFPREQKLCRVRVSINYFIQIANCGGGHIRVLYKQALNFLEYLQNHGIWLYELHQCFFYPIWRNFLGTEWCHGLILKRWQNYFIKGDFLPIFKWNGPGNMCSPSLDLNAGTWWLWHGLWQINVVVDDWWAQS
jgi:hypothetical protein